MRRREFIGGAAALLAAAEGRNPVLLRTAAGAAASLYWGEEWDKPFLYPIRTVPGRVLSRGWPVEPREGDSEDHAWHRGIWYGHGIVNGADFWREQGRAKTGRLMAKARPRAEGNGVSIELSMTPPSGKEIGGVRQEFQVADKGDVRMIDAVIEIRADKGQGLTFGDSDDGGFAFRLREAFREDRGARLRNSEGLEGTKNIWGRPARWVDYSALLDGGRAGVAIFDHPSNFRHPTRWHARGYGLNSANPFASRSFTGAPAAGGSYTLPAGEKLVLRYRTLVYEGSPDIERHYGEYARQR